MDTLGFDLRGNLVGIVGGGGAFPWTEGEDVDLGEARFAADTLGGGVVGLGLAGEAYDHIGGEGGQVERFAHEAQAIQKQLASPAAAHAAQNRVRTALQADVQVRADSVRVVLQHAN